MTHRGTLRGAIVGCGYFGRIQLEAWARITGVEFVAACDTRTPTPFVRQAAGHFLPGS
jgi:hypothetical protein